MALRGFLSRRRLFGIAILYLWLASPPARAWLEASMSGHMLIQIPLLAAIGLAAGRLLPEWRQQALRELAGGPISCVVIALFASSYWMLPRALDAALVDPVAEAAKFLSIPLLVGLPLGLSWAQLNVIGRHFVWTNVISMIAVLGWLYIAAPVRLCNNYLVDQQEQAGWWMVNLSLLMFAWWLFALFIGDRTIDARPVSAAMDAGVHGASLA